MNKAEVLEAKSLALSSENIIISTHKSPDGDAIGSSLALMHYLKSLGKEAKVIVPDAFPDFLSWMNSSEEVLAYDGNEEEVESLISKADLIFSLDYNVLKRTGDLCPVLEKAEADFILIDHHQQPGDYAKYIFSDTKACSTAQMIFEFIEAAGDKELIDVSMAEAIYCGIMTDTGSFRFPSVTPKTHEIAAFLINRGLDHAQVHRAVYDTNALSRLRLLGYALREKLVVREDLNTAYIVLSKKELDDHNFRKGDTEGLVNYALSLSGIRFAAFIREANNGVRMSFRSKGSFDVNQFARKYFDGGGHINAAGGICLLPLAEVEKEFNRVVEECKLDLI